MNILITGGAGFIGSNIAKSHLNKGDSVWIIDNFSSGRHSNIEEMIDHPNFILDTASIQECKNLHKAVEWADYIYHMAASIGQYLIISSPITTLSNNVQAFQKVLDTIVEVNKKVRIVLASSSCVYSHTIPSQDGLLHEDATLSFKHNEPYQITYSISKLFDEVLANAYILEKDIDCVIARIFNTIGINQRSRYGMVVPNFIQQALNNEPITVFGSGEQSRAFVNVHDTVKALHSLLKNGATKGLVVNVGGNQCSTINALAHLVKERTSSNSEIIHIPYKEAYGVDFIDVEQRCPSIERLKKYTGYEPEWTLTETIDEIIANLKEKTIMID